MKNILVISSNLDAKGGIVSVVNNLINSDLKNEYNFIHLASHTNGNSLKKIAYMIKSYICFPFLLLFNNISLIHIHSGSIRRKSFFAIVGKLFGKKIIFHLHAAMLDEYMQRSYFHKKHAMFVFDLCDAIIVISRYWANVLKNYTQSDTFVVYNSIPIPESSANEHKQKEKITVFTMGELGQRKGTYDIIESAKYIINPDVVIDLYGNGDVEGCEKLINESNLQERIKIKGWVSGFRKDEVFKNSNIYILPSYYEGLPMSILEAMAYGLPVISTPIAGIPEAVEDGVSGFLIPPGDAHALADRINMLANDKELREKMGAESYRIAKEKFDINVIIKQLREIYDELLK